MVAILERLKTAVAGKRRQAMGTWREIVEAVHADRNVSETELLDAMQAAGKTIADLETDVERLKQRVQLASQLDHAKAAAVRFEELDAKVKSETERWNAEAEAVTAKWRPILARLREDRATAQSGSAGAESYAEQLVSTAWPDEREALELLNQERLAIATKQGERQRYLSVLKTDLNGNRRPDDQDALKEDLSPKIAGTEAQLAQFETELADIDERIAAIRASMLEP